MYFDNNEELILTSTNQQLDDRWSVINSKILADYTNTNKRWYDDVKSGEFENTKIHLGMDKKLGRPVIIKTINYKEKLDEESVLISRNRIENQINLLNEISSPQLPEPLDYFNVINDKDEQMDLSLVKDEPVLILEYQPGETLRNELRRREAYKNENDRIRLDYVARIAKNILYFIKTTAEKDYLHLGLSPNHIIMLKNENIRVVGLSKIIKTNNNKIKIDDIKCRYTYGHTAPELYDIENKDELDAKAVASFSLGVILCLLLCERTVVEDYMITKVNNNAIFTYPNEVCRKMIKNNVVNEDKYRLIDKLLYDLCNVDPNKRLTEFDKIEEILAQIGGEVVVKKNDKKLLEVNRSGEIVRKQKNNRWVVKDQINFYEYDIYPYGENMDVINSLKIGSLVEFNVVQNNKGKKSAVKIRLCEDTITDEDIKGIINPVISLDKNINEDINEDINKDNNSSRKNNIKIITKLLRDKLKI